MASAVNKHAITVLKVTAVGSLLAIGQGLLSPLLFDQPLGITWTQPTSTQASDQPADLDRWSYVVSEQRGHRMAIAYRSSWAAGRSVNVFEQTVSSSVVRGECRLHAGVLQGLWHGLIAPVTLIMSFFNENVQMYEVHNDGKEYNLGFLLGVALVFLILGFSGRRR